MKRRIIFDYIRKREESVFNRIFVLTGARQTGKTTIARHCFSGYAYLSIEDPVERYNYLKLTASQWNKFYSKAILDEVQKEPVLIESIKSVYDQFEESRYVLLGSSQFLLMEKVKESLAGRCIIIDLYPLTLPELISSGVEDSMDTSYFFKYANGEITTEDIYPSFSMDPLYAVKTGTYDYYRRFGGYPALTNEAFSDEDRYEWLEMYIRTFLERDIRDLASFRDLEPFIKLLRYMANTTAELANFSSIAKETGVSIPTVQRYIKYMEISYQAIFLPAWFSNPIKKLIKSPKIHFMDYGVLQSILQKRGEPTGNEYESIIISEIYKQIKTYRLPLTCYHLRTQGGKEIDMLLEAADYFIAAQHNIPSWVRDFGRETVLHALAVERTVDCPFFRKVVRSLFDVFRIFTYIDDDHGYTSRFYFT